MLFFPTRPLSFRSSFHFPHQFCSKTITSTTTTATMHSSVSPSRESHKVSSSGEAAISVEEWQGWGTTSPIPAMVTQVVDDLKLLQKDSDADMIFGGNHGKLSGDFKVQEDKKHRATYQSLGDSETKLQFFSARQIACRVLGSRGYLCQKCWLPSEDCMCSKLISCPLWHRVRFWLYMHPKDFLRQNNTGKLLWQVFGIQAATLCLYGIAEHEEMMGGALKLADGGHSLNFILIDGTWSNSGAMFSRLKDRYELMWGDELPCIMLNTGASLMHKLRPQPSWDRTCTAAAAIGLLDELHDLPNFVSYGLDKQAKAIEDAVEVLLEALTARRLRMGRSITRKQRHNRDIL
ncbi:uncharacterized protein LOC107830486 isoform X3 [Nicotiana tabacum]|uniref:tRNA-uridine aminocarboxypropyltransferase n=1 Tax=Nicotiana tabacum TaxID=4097 RepID=A0A1S4DJG1_TOBAC|nr:PREDICTED: uncharacterized protein LOC107830486 isoform X3 [Nicotiana tabacum]